MKGALKAIEQGLSIKAASVKFSVPKQLYTILYRLGIQNIIIQNLENVEHSERKE